MERGVPSNKSLICLPDWCHRAMHKAVLERFSPENIFGKKKELQGAVLAIAEKVGTLPALSDESPPPHALLYGGGVRDLILGEPLRDADLQVYGVAPDNLEQILHELFPGGVERAGKEYEIIKARIGKRDTLDISIPRRKTGGISRFEEGEPDMFPLEAARYRDFTINSMALDPLSGIVYDPFNGRADLAARRLRIVDNDTFRLRGVHLFRAAQFAARFNLTIDDESSRFMAELARSQIMDQVPPNAIREELRKLVLIARKPSEGLAILHRLGLLRRFLPPRITSQSAAQLKLWMTLIDRGIQLGRSVRLYPEHIFTAQLALLLSPLRSLTDKQRQREEIERTLTGLCYSDFKQKGVAEIFELYVTLEPLLVQQPQRRVGRARPQRGLRSRSASESGECVAASDDGGVNPINAPLPAIILTAAALSGRPYAEVSAVINAVTAE